MFYASAFHSLESVPHDQLPSVLFNEAMAARKMLERAWSEETAYQGIQLVPQDTPSRGQCGVTSLWLGRYLIDRAGDGVEVNFVEGVTQMDRLNDDLVWVDVAANGEEPWIIDLTQDQYKTTNASVLHVGRYEEKPENIGRYVVHKRFNPYKVPRKKLLRRFALLESNIHALRPWQRMDTPFARSLGGLGIGIRPY